MLNLSLTLCLYRNGKYIKTTGGVIVTISLNIYICEDKYNMYVGRYLYTFLFFFLNKRYLYLYNVENVPINK